MLYFATRLSEYCLCWTVKLRGVRGASFVIVATTEKYMENGNEESERIISNKVMGIDVN